MLSIDVINRKRQVVDKIEVREALFQGPVNRLLLSDVVRVQLRNLREGNAATKTRADVNLTNRKIYRQKGTGQARHSSRKAPIFVGGGTVFGPHPRDYAVVLPQKVRRFAFLSALRLKWKEGKVLVIKDLSFKEPKTKEALGYFKDLGVPQALVILNNRDDAVTKSIRNIPLFSTVMSQGVRVLDLVKSDYVLCTPDALKHLEARILGGA